MEFRAHFSQIGTAIVTELASATHEVTVAVAWLTDPDLFTALLAVARRGVKVRLAVLADEINARSGLNLERLKSLGADVFQLPLGDGGDGSLHHKFCVIDREVVITGSYNWTRRATRADENILLVRGDSVLAEGYLKAFDELLTKYGQTSELPRFDSEMLKRRLTIILNLLELGDEGAIGTQIEKLEPMRHRPSMARLLGLLRSGTIDEAKELIRELMVRATALVPSESYAIAALRKV